jgi:hypothetical protein
MRPIVIALLAAHALAACSSDPAAGNGPARDGGSGGRDATTDDGADGDSTTVDAAGDDAVAPEDAAEGSDDAAGCRAGTRFCDGTDVVECNADGSTTVIQQCDGRCVGATCATSMCDSVGKTYFGCGFIAVDLDNSDIVSFGSSAAAQQFAVTVSNPNEVSVDVTVRNGEGNIVAGPLTIAPLALQSIDLPRADADNTSLTYNTYRIESTSPVTAHQFNPEQNVDVYSNDASLLLPIRSLGTEYIILGWPTEVQNIPIVGPRPLLSNVTIASAGTGVTEVTILAPSGAAIAAGPGFDTLAAGATRTVELQPGQVLSLTTTQVDEADMTGMEIFANRPIAVFSGSECANIPLGNQYCDHIEEQNVPVTAWGSEYVAAKFEPRGNEPDLYRIIAENDGTVITTTPPQPGANNVTVQRGEAIEFESTESFVVSGTGRIAVAQYMVGSAYPGPENGCTRDPDSINPQTCAIPGNFACIQESGIGDPAILMLVPDSQLRSDYVYLTPADYMEDYVSIVYEGDVTFTLDGAAVTSSGTPIGSTGRRVLRLPMEDGAHRIEGTAPFALYVYGYDCDVSYAYAGGLNVESSE